jgi:predicted small lipoprotein YifL
MVRISLQLRGFPALARPRQSLYGAARIGDSVVNRNLCPKSSGWAVIVLAMAVLTLAGCGRKGPLDLPPTASSPNSSSPVASAAPEPSDTAAEAAAKPSLFNPSYGTDAAPVAPKGRKKPFVLDPLLGN